MTIVHISDTHGLKGHLPLSIPNCDVLVHTGDIGGRTNLLELTQFLEWFEKQSARIKIFIAGNHDIILDGKFIDGLELDSVNRMILQQQHQDAVKLIDRYNVKYLNGKEFVFEGVKFYGSPYSPSFHRHNWAFNADRGEEISKEWAKIPSGVNVLLTHGPCYGILDDVKEFAMPNEIPHVGCKDLLNVIKKRLFDLQLHCSGHIHDNTAVVLEKVSQTRRVLFSNGAVLNNEYKQIIIKPLIITI